MQPSKTTPMCEIDLDQFKSLLYDLERHQKEIPIRLQVKGEPWTEKFSSVLVFSRHAFLLSHIPARTIKNIPDLKNVSGFEIDQPYKILMPYERYPIHTPSEPFKIKRDGLRYA